MPSNRRLLSTAAALAVIVCGMTACEGDRTDPPRELPNPSLPQSTPAAPAQRVPAAEPPRSDAPAPPEAPATPSATVPAAYLGEWQRTGTSCATRDETRLRIEAQRVTFHESSGTVQAADAEDGRLTLTLRMTGEGETRDATYRYGLSNDGRWLTDLENDLVRERCP